MKGNREPGSRNSWGFLSSLGAVLLSAIGCSSGTGGATPTADDDKTPAVETAANSAKPVASTSSADGEDWPMFLGPQGTGVSGETGILEKWPKDGPAILWEKEIGSGYSAPSVRGNQLVIHHRLRNEEIVECLRADNSERIWRYAYESNFIDPYNYSNGPRCSPLLTEDRCYTFGAEGMLLCLGLKDGKPIWQRDTQQDFQIPKAFFGVGSTPILEGDVLITQVGGQPNSGVVAFNAQTGKTVWESVGKQTWNGVETGFPGDDGGYFWTGEETMASYSSPIAVTIHGKRHVLCLTAQGLVSLDPRTGKENFKYWFRSRAYESVNAARPVVIGDKIFLSAAYKVGSVLLRVEKNGKGYKELWRNTENMLTHWSTVIHVDGHLYGFSGRHDYEGTFRCISLDSGKVVWETAGRLANIDYLIQDPRTGRYYNRESRELVPNPFYGRGSKIRVGGKFIVLGEYGALALVEVNAKKFQEIARTSYFKQISYPVWAAPVLSRKRLYLRDEDALICLDLSPKPKEE